MSRYVGPVGDAPRSIMTREAIDIEAADLSDDPPAALADPASPGVGTTAARDDHTHPTTGLEPAGTATTFVSAHTSGQPHVDLSSDIPAALGTPAAGADATAARAGHVHGMPRVDQLSQPTAAQSMNNQKITGLGTPTNGTDAATKAYVDALIADLQSQITAGGGEVPADALITHAGDPLVTHTGDVLVIGG